MNQANVQHGLASTLPAPATRFQQRLAQRERAAGLEDEQLRTLPREELFARLEAAIGNTPLTRQPLGNGNVLLLKDETANPTESHYDRCYVELIKHYESLGKISPGDTLLETTSGSAGVSFAWICKKLGYEAVVFMPGFVPKPRIIEVENLATAVHLNHDRDNYLLASAKDMRNFFNEHRRRIAREGRRIWMPNHSQDFLTPKAFARIADEVLQEGGSPSVHYFIGGIGNGSTLLGIGERLKEISPGCQVIAFEPLNACPFYKRFKERWGRIAPRFIEEEAQIPEGFSFHELPGTGTFGNLKFPFMEAAIERSVLDDVCPVPDTLVREEVSAAESKQPNDRLGNTSLVARHIATRLARNLRNSNLLTLVYDRGDRYGAPAYIG